MQYPRPGHGAESPGTRKLPVARRGERTLLLRLCPGSGCRLRVTAAPPSRALRVRLTPGPGRGLRLLGAAWAADSLRPPGQWTRHRRHQPECNAAEAARRGWLDRRAATRTRTATGSGRACSRRSAVHSRKSCKFQVVGAVPRPPEVAIIMILVAAVASCIRAPGSPVRANPHHGAACCDVPPTHTPPPPPPPNQSSPIPFGARYV